MNPPFTHLGWNLKKSFLSGRLHIKGTYPPNFMFLRLPVWPGHWSVSQSVSQSAIKSVFYFIYRDLEINQVTGVCAKYHHSLKIWKSVHSNTWSKISLFASQLNRRSMTKPIEYQVLSCREKTGTERVPVFFQTIRNIFISSMEPVKFHLKICHVSKDCQNVLLCNLGFLLKVRCFTYPDTFYSLGDMYFIS